MPLNTTVYQPTGSAPLKVWRLSSSHTHKHEQTHFYLTRHANVFQTIKAQKLNSGQ